MENHFEKATASEKQTNFQEIPYLEDTLKSQKTDNIQSEKITFADYQAFSNEGSEMFLV